MGKLAGDGNIKLYVKCTVLETGQSYATQDVVELRKPKLVVTVSRLRKVSSGRSFLALLGLCQIVFCQPANYLQIQRL